jgi:hypothetical protein
MKEMGDVIVKSPQLLKEAVPLLHAISSEAVYISELTAQMSSLEGRGDELHDILELAGVLVEFLVVLGASIRSTPSRSLLPAPQHGGWDDANNSGIAFLHAWACTRPVAPSGTRLLRERCLADIHTERIRTSRQGERGVDQVTRALWQGTAAHPSRSKRCGCSSHRLPHEEKPVDATAVAFLLVDRDDCLGRMQPTGARPTRSPRSRWSTRRAWTGRSCRTYGRGRPTRTCRTARCCR